MLFYRITFGEAEDIWGRTAIWIGRKAIWTAIKKYFVRKTNYDSETCANPSSAEALMPIDITNFSFTGTLTVGFNQVRTCKCEKYTTY